MWSLLTHIALELFISLSGPATQRAQNVNKPSAKPGKYEAAVNNNICDSPKLVNICAMSQYSYKLKMFLCFD